MPNYHNRQPFYHRVTMAFEARTEFNANTLQSALARFLHKHRPSDLGVIGSSVQIEVLTYEGPFPDGDEQVRHDYGAVLLFTSVTGFGEVRFMAAMNTFIGSAYASDLLIIPGTVTIPKDGYEDPEAGDPSDL